MENYNDNDYEMLIMLKMEVPKLEFAEELRTRIYFHTFL